MRPTLRNTLTLLIAFTLVLSASYTMAGCPNKECENQKPDLIDTAVGAGSFKTLAAALTAAELIEPLRGEGPFTVFAPTDEAFEKLPEGTVEALLKDKEKLTSILLYHVVSGRVMAEDVVKLEEAETLQGQSVRINTEDGVMINSATVIKADVTASNGVIHVIDEVLLPE